MACLGGQALGTQTGGALADRLGGQAGPLGQFQAADAAGSRGAQEVEDQGGVVAAQGEQVRSGASAARHRLRPVHLAILPVACTLATALRKWES